MVNSVERGWRQPTAVRPAQAGRTRMMMRLVVIVGTLGLVQAALRVLMPLMLTVAEILLGIGQAGVTFLRACGV